jgi:TolB-like protein
VLLPTVAVLPFDSGVDAGHRVVGDLLADGVISQLSHTAELRVISRLSTGAFAGRTVPPEAIAAHLRANFVVSGSVHVQGARMVVSAELCETSSGAVAWADRLTGNVSELVEAHGDLIHRIGAAVHSSILARAVHRARGAPLPTLESYALLLGAIQLMHRQSRFEFDRARTLLEHLVERHPRHAAPRAWLAKWFALAAAQGWRRDASTATAEARRHVESALSCEPSSAMAWAVKGLLQGYVDADFSGAQDAQLEALRHNPNESLAWLYLGTLHGWRGERDAAIEAADQALALSPLDPLRYYFDSLAGAAMLGARRYDRAVELSQRSIRSNRAHLSTYRVLTMAQALSGDEAAARTSATELLRHDRTFTVKRFLEVSPWRMSPDADVLGEALKTAGIPAG